MSNELGISIFVVPEKICEQYPYSYLIGCACRLLMYFSKTNVFLTYSFALNYQKKKKKKNTKHIHCKFRFALLVFQVLIFHQQH